VTQPMPLAITLGDPAGIGPEIILKLFAQGLDTPCLVYGDVGLLTALAKRLALPVVIQPHTLGEPVPHSAGIAPVVQATEPVPADLAIGQVSETAGRVAHQALQSAIDDALAGNVRGIVTAPLNKQAIHLAGVKFPGHTEILAQRCGNVPVAMMLVNEQLRVLLVTIHVALRDVSELITLDLELQAIELAHRACLQMGIQKPRVAVAGLNPHAGEGGKFGPEEITVISPAIQLACDRGIQASGPWPGDTIFSRARTGEFDIVVAQYHDQGLIPIKYLGIDEGVNVTVGLPFVRTSVDHGTAFDIAGKGVASPDSLRQAVLLADLFSSAKRQ
jgi:4-hydroxythreonine-4-phosphate dehydrogenase